MPNEEQTADELGVRKRVSIVWKYFEKLSKFRVRCNLCQHEQNYQSTTGNILRHLKSKHNIDATLKGQKENPDGILVPKLEIKESKSRADEDEDVHMNDEDSRFEDNVAVTPRQERGQREARTKVVSYCEDAEEDPYAEESIQYEEYMVTADTTTATAEGSKETPRSPAKKRKVSLEEQRILAETEYFREKAAYYRMQKNLAALQAKKVKYELDQLNN